MNLHFSPEFSEQHPILEGPEAHHALNVLRLGPGDPIHLTNGTGTRFDGRILTTGKVRCEVTIEHLQHTQREPSGIHLAVAIIKNSDRMEWMVEKLTEIGISSLTFLVTANTERKTINMERLEKTAISAIKQAGRTWLPELRGPIEFSEMLASATGDRYIASAGHKDAQGLIDQVRATSGRLIVIGPEGDFTEQEFTQATACGFRPLGLGSATLRTETAALHACVAMNLTAGRS